MSSSRALVSNQGLISKKADAAYARYRIVVEGSDADHVKYPAAVSDRPTGILVDGCEAAEDVVSVALLGRGETKVVKLNGTCNKGDWLTAEDPATAAVGQARAVPATPGAFWVIGRALESGADEQEIAVEDCVPFLGGAQDDGQLSLPSFAGDPATPVNSQLWHDHTNHRIRARLNGATVTIANLLAMVVFVLGALVALPAVGADKTPMVQSDATTGKVAAAVLADNVKVPGTLEVTGTSLHTGAVTFTAAPVFSDAAGSRTALGLAIGTDVEAYDAELAAVAGLTSAANALPYFTGAGTAGVISSSANMVSLLGSANYATARTNLGLAIGTDVQAYDADLTTYAGITPSANVQTFLAAADNAAMAVIIGAALAEGGLANSTVVTADIKDGEVVDADVNASAAIANTKLGLPAVRTVTQAVTVSEFTDNTDATGYIDLSSQIPAQSIVLGWKINVTSGFAGDTTAVAQVGAAGNLDKFSADTTQSVLGVAKVGSNALAAESYTTAATTVRVTVTGGADFTTIKTANTAACTVTVYYVQTE